MLCDLHLHSHHSDGEFPPARVVDMVADAGVSLLALTDHDTTAGYEEARKRALERGIVAIGGIEMTAYANHRVVHVLGYGVEPTSDALDRRNRVALESPLRQLMRMLVGVRTVAFNPKGADGAVALVFSLACTLAACRTGFCG